MACNEGVQATNDDASECKRCAVQLGYWEDRYISLFVRAGEKKTPEINRGYYARAKGVEMFVDKFLKVWCILMFYTFVSQSLGFAFNRCIFTCSRKVGVNIKLSTWDLALIRYTGG
jgi:hypothetical protein